MGRKSRIKKIIRIRKATAINAADKQGLIANKMLWAICFILAVLVPLASRIHTMGALFGLPLSATASFYFMDILCLRFLGRHFNPPCRYGPSPYGKPTWVDYILSIAASAIMIGLLFLFGEYTDWIRGENIWQLS